MKVGILGSGNVAQALGTGFVTHGHTVQLGTRNPQKLSSWLDTAGARASAGSFKETASFGNILVLAVKGSVAMDVLHQSGDISDKIIIDATNPIADAPPENGVLNFFTDQNSSLMEQLEEKFPQAKFVKAFSCVGSAFMVNPQFDGLTPTMFIAGNDKSAKQQVTAILDMFGWDIEDMGTAEAARAIEPLCKLWCIPGFRENRWSHAFKLLK